MVEHVIVLLVLGIAVFVGLGVPLLLLLIKFRRYIASRPGGPDRPGPAGHED